MGADLYFFEPGQTEITDEQRKTLWTTNESLGYYRDPYNPTSTLSTFGLSWWTDVGSLLDDEGNLDDAGAKAFLNLLDRYDDVFAERVEARCDELRATCRDDLALLKRLLQRVIDTPGSKLRCWL
jgi:hypothetical protein